MRNKLIKLVEECGDACLQAHIPLTSERIADHLLSEGVIVPPVKVGQTVYVLCEDFGSIFECKIHSMHYIDGVWTGHVRNTWIHSYGSLYNWTESDFENSIFFTKEEAEKALAERSEG